MSDTLESMTCSADPGVGQVITIRTPVFGITFHVEETDSASLLQLHEAAMALVGDQLTHHQSGNMEKPGRLTPRARTIVPTWFRKPNWRQAGSTFSDTWGGSDLGVGCPSYEVAFWPNKKRPLAKLEEVHRNGLGREHREDYPFCSSVALGLPLDHVLTDADALRDWLGSLDIVKSGEFVFIESGYRLLSLGSAFGGDFAREEERLLSRYPGLDLLEPRASAGSQ